MKQKLLSAITIFVFLAFTAQAQTLAINNVMNMALVCQVQQDSSSVTNCKITTKSLLELIATDQGFTLPAKAKLWLANDSFFVLNADDTIFTNIDTNILNITYVTAVLKSKLIQTTNTYKDTINGTSIVTLNYNGSSASFTFNCCGKQNFLNKVRNTNAVALSSFSGSGFGPGIYDGQNMIVKGSLTGKFNQRYTVGGGVGTFPPGDLGTFPGDGVLGTFPGNSDMPVPGSGSTVP